MKRGIIRKTTCLLALMLCLCVATGCSEGSDAGGVRAQEEIKKTSSSIGQYCLDLIKLLNEKVHNDTYVELIATQALTKSDAFARLRAGNYDAPDQIYKITFGEQGFSMFYELSFGKKDDFGDMSEELKASLQSQMLNSYVNLLTGRFIGSERLALQSMFTAQKLFVAEEKNLSCIYLYVYKEAYPVAVCIEGSEDSATRANASFVLIDDFKADSKDDVISSMFPSLMEGVDLMELYGAEVEEIK